MLDNQHLSVKGIVSRYWYGIKGEGGANEHSTNKRRKRLVTQQIDSLSEHVTKTTKITKKMLSVVAVEPVPVQHKGVLQRQIAGGNSHLFACWEIAVGLVGTKGLFNTVVPLWLESYSGLGGRPPARNARNTPMAVYIQHTVQYVTGTVSVQTRSN